MHSQRAPQSQPEPPQEPGQLVKSNLQLTYSVTQLETATRRLNVQLSAAKRVKFVLDQSPDLAPAAVLGGICVVPPSTSADRVYRLPPPRLLATHKVAQRSFDMHVRNDSAHLVTLVAEHKGVLIDGPSTVEAHSGSHWNVVVTCADEGREAYEVTRLI